VDERLLYRVPEVAAHLNISRSKVYELLASGNLPSVKIDRTVWCVVVTSGRKQTLIGLCALGSAGRVARPAP
jgi:excisionase family DNA binding protein